MFVRTLAALLSVFAGLSLLAAETPAVREASPAGITVEEIIGRMLQMDSQRLSALRRYEARRLYVADNRRFNKHAEMEFREEYAHPGQKNFELLSEEGSGYVRRKVIQKMIDAELDSVTDDNRDQTKVTPQNYKFRLLGAEEMDGRSCYVIEVSPKKRKKYLIDGRIWVHQQEFAIVRMEGKPAKNPSFWTRKVHFVRRYKKHGPFWLTDSLESESSVWIAGKSTLKIDYSGYEVNQASASAPEISAAPNVAGASFSGHPPTIENSGRPGMRTAGSTGYGNQIAPDAQGAVQSESVAPPEGREP